MDENFYLGLLCALRERSDLDYLVIEGEEFHQAFGEAVRRGNEKGLTDLEVAIDPIFGVYHEAVDFIYEGLYGFVLDMGSCSGRADFRISREYAAKELDIIGNADLYREIADKFLKNS